MIQYSTRQNRKLRQLIFAVSISLLFSGFAEAAVHVSPNCNCRHGICVPNAGNYGYYQTSWRTWQTEYGHRPDKTFPQSIGVESIPTPKGVEALPLPKETLSEPTRGTGRGILPEGRNIIIQEGQPQLPLDRQLGLPGLPELESPVPLQPGLNQELPLTPDALQEQPLGEPQGRLEPQPVDDRKPFADTNKSFYPQQDSTVLLEETPVDAVSTVSIRPFERTSILLKKVQADVTPIAKSQPVKARPQTSEADLIGTVVASDAKVQQVEHGNVLGTKSEPTASSKQTPVVEPALALDGYCPVELGEHEIWVEGKSDCEVVFRGHVYRMSSEKRKVQFEINSERYAPVLSGCDVVLAMEEGRMEQGKTEFCVIFEGRLHMFVSAKTLEFFQREPKRFTELMKESVR